jgi:hypothetical protein
VSTTTCIFCGRRGERAKEHVFPIWLLQHLREGEVAHDYLHLSGQGDTLSVRRHNLQKLAFGRVCAACNNGWLSELRRFEQSDDHGHEESYANEPRALDLSSAVTTSVAIAADMDFQLPRPPIDAYGEATRGAIRASMPGGTRNTYPCPAHRPSPITD